MSVSFVHKTVIAVAFLQASTAGPQVLDPTTDRDTYAVYATLLPLSSEEQQAIGPIVLQRETERPTSCTAFLAQMTGEWAEVAASFQQENSRVRLLQPGALGKYRLVSRAEILANDARLAPEHTGLTNSLRPGAIQYPGVLRRRFQRRQDEGAGVHAKPNVKRHIRRHRDEGMERGPLDDRLAIVRWCRVTSRRTTTSRSHRRVEPSR